MIVQLPIGPMQNFMYLIVCQETKTCAVVDPGFEHEKALIYAQQHDLAITHILCTHRHYDHIQEVPQLYEATKAKVYIHKLETASLSVPHTTYKDQDSITVGKHSITCIHTPGQDRKSVV